MHVCSYEKVCICFVFAHSQHHFIDLMWISLVYCTYNKIKKGARLQCYYSCVACLVFISCNPFARYPCTIRAKFTTCSHLCTMHTTQSVHNVHIFSFSIFSRIMPIEISLFLPNIIVISQKRNSSITIAIHSFDIDFKNSIKFLFSSTHTQTHATIFIYAFLACLSLFFSLLLVPFSCACGKLATKHEAITIDFCFI